MNRNLPCAKGRELGREIARLTPQVPEMCNGCAFKEGTFANGCLSTLMDAAVCVLAGTAFHCHIKKNGNGDDALCAGFMAALRSRNEKEFLEATGIKFDD
jgi:hypothetical protein